MRTSALYHISFPTFFNVTLSTFKQQLTKLPEMMCLPHNQTTHREHWALLQ